MKLPGLFLLVALPSVLGRQVPSDAPAPTEILDIYNPEVQTLYLRMLNYVKQTFNFPQNTSCQYHDDKKLDAACVAAAKKFLANFSDVAPAKMMYPACGEPEEISRASNSTSMWIKVKNALCYVTNCTLKEMKARNGKICRVPAGSKPRAYCSSNVERGPGYNGTKFICRSIDEQTQIAKKMAESQSNEPDIYDAAVQTVFSSLSQFANEFPVDDYLAAAKPKHISDSVIHGKQTISITGVAFYKTICKARNVNEFSTIPCPAKTPFETYMNCEASVNGVNYNYSCSVAPPTHQRTVAPWGVAQKTKAGQWNLTLVDQRVNLFSKSLMWLLPGQPESMHKTVTDGGTKVQFNNVPFYTSKCLKSGVLSGRAVNCKVPAGTVPLTHCSATIEQTDGLTKSAVKLLGCL